MSQEEVDRLKWEKQFANAFDERRKEAEARRTTKQAAINKIIDEDPVNNWWLEEDAFEGWR